MSREWQRLPFSQAVVINPAVRLQRGGVYPFVDMNAVDPNRPIVHMSEERAFTGGGSCFESGDTLFARITPCLENGKIARFKGSGDEERPAHGSTEFIVMRGRDGVSDTNFVFYLARSPQVRSFAISQMMGTSGRQRVPNACFEKLAVSLPRFSEQRAIAGVLGALDEKVEQNRRTTQVLQRLARAIFRAWFVDFEPVKAKAAGATTFPSMPQSSFEILPTRLVDSAIGLVPDGWLPTAVSTAFQVNPTRSLRRAAPAPYLEMKNMPTQGHAPDSWIVRPFGSGMRFMNGDTLVARITPCLENGKTAFVDFLDDGQIAWGSTEYIVLRSKPPLPAVFAYCLARTGEFRDFAIQNMTGTSGRQRVAQTAMDHFRIAMPSDSVAVCFGEVVQPLFNSIRVAMVTCPLSPYQSLRGSPGGQGYRQSGG